MRLPVNNKKPKILIKPKEEEEKEERERRTKSSIVIRSVEARRQSPPTRYLIAS